MRSIPEAAIAVLRRNPEELADMIQSLDPFQKVGIPCWQSYAGPLQEPCTPTRSWYDTVTAFDCKPYSVCRYCGRGNDICSCD